MKIKVAVNHVLHVNNNDVFAPLFDSFSLLNQANKNRLTS